MNSFHIPNFKIWLLLIILIIPVSNINAQNVNYAVNSSTGAISKLWIVGDAKNMDWIIATDGSQYQWAAEKYGWGLGYFSITENGINKRVEWKIPRFLAKDGSRAKYDAGGIEVEVDRKIVKGNLYERYTFTNRVGSAVVLDSIGIYTPFNDNYPNAETCMSNRAHAHIWAAENSSYVNLVNMGANAPHLALAMIEGSISGYDICEKKSSNVRGIISLSPTGKTLMHGESFSVEWKLFANVGWNDFFEKLVSSGCVHVSMDKYVFEKGETATINVVGKENELKDCRISIGGRNIDVSGNNGCRVAKVIIDTLGEVRIDISYGNGKSTHADCLVVSSFDGMMDKRVNFILQHQQMNSITDPRYGAFIVYDNETESIYFNDTPNSSPGDRCEGAERLGMGVLLAKYCLSHPDDRIKESLIKYADFVRRGLQDADFNTWRSMSHVWGHRVYNYPWISEFYFLMYNLTGEKKYALYGYKTLRAMYRQFGHSRYPIGQPVRLSMQCLKDAGMTSERDSLLADYRAVGDNYIKIGLNYPQHEVNYEQSIVAPCVVFLEEMYLLTGEKKYLDQVEKQLPVLEAFNGFQPSCHLYDISIRHWDGFWFGKLERWGDTMPHYWSCVTAHAFSLYSKCTGNRLYQLRAERIIENNFCLFTEDGRGSCAYLYPNHIDGLGGKFYDPYANDQDWALSYFLDIKY